MNKGLFTLLFLLFFCATPTSALAQKSPETNISASGTTVWLVDAPTLDASTVESLHKSLKEALSGDTGQHLHGESAFRDYIKRNTPPPPACLHGTKSCNSPSTMIFDALQLSLVVRIKLRKSSGQFEAAYTQTDRRGKPSNTKIATGRTTRDLAFTLVRTIYDAAGVVEFKTTPPGAQVLINGSNIGVTPLKRRLPIGRHLYTLRLENHQVVEENVDVAPKGATLIEKKLDKLPGMLILEGVPAGARVTTKGKDPFDATQPIELPAGKYAFDVSAQGFETAKLNVELVAGVSIRRAVTLKKLNPLLRDIPEEAIIHNRYWARLSGEIGFQSTTFRGARDMDDNVELEFRRFHDPTNPTQNIDTTTNISPAGLRLDVGYTWKHLGITYLGVSYLTTEIDQPAVIEDLSTGTTFQGRVKSVRQLQLRPAQVRWRFIYKNLVPHAELGLGVNFQTLEIRDSQDFPREFSQTEAFWTIGLGVQYFFSPLFFATARYSAQGYFNTGVGLQNFLSIGIGGAFPNIFGFEPEPPEKLE